MTTPPDIHGVEATDPRVARFERILDHLESIYDDANAVIDYLTFGRDLDDLSLDLASDLAQIKALAGTSRRRTKELIQRQQARAERSSR